MKIGTLLILPMLLFAIACLVIDGRCDGLPDDRNDGSVNSPGIHGPSRDRRKEERERKDPLFGQSGLQGFQTVCPERSDECFITLETTRACDGVELPPGVTTRVASEKAIPTDKRDYGDTVRQWAAASALGAGRWNYSVTGDVQLTNPGDVPVSCFVGMTFAGIQTISERQPSDAGAQGTFVVPARQSIHVPFAREIWLEGPGAVEGFSVVVTVAPTGGPLRCAGVSYTTTEHLPR